MIREVTKDIYSRAWHEFSGSPLQSWQWGELKKERWEVEWLGIFVKDELLAVVMMLLRRFPCSIVTRFFGFEFLAYIPRGVAVKDVKFFKKVLEDLEKYASKKGVAFILIDPERNFSIKNWNEEFKKALEAKDWKVAGAPIEPNQTNVIELDRSDEDLFAAMKPKWRRNIKKAKRHGVEVREVCDISAVDNFYSVISVVEKNTKFKARSEGYFKRMWGVLGQDGFVRIFVATYNREVVASYLVLVTNQAAYEIYGGATSKGRDLEAAYLLKWEIMRTMRTGGRKFYDHWGVAPKDEDGHPLSGISYFKSGFGGEYMEFLPQYVKIFNQGAYFFYRIFKRFAS